MLGTISLWFGWYGFNSGSALPGSNPASAEIAALAAVNTTLAGGAAGIAALFFNLYLLERCTGEPYFDIKYAMNGSLCGLVAITAGCGVFEPWAAFVTGLCAGLIYVGGSRLLIAVRIDDAVDAIPVHMFSGIWGLLCVGFLASPERLKAVYGGGDHPGLFYSFGQGKPDGTLLACQIIGMLFIVGWVMVIMLPFFVWLDWKGWFRSDPLEEIVGLDTSYHGGLALLNGEEHVDPEYITAYKEKKQEKLRRRNVRRQFNSDTVGPEDEDPDEDDEPEEADNVRQDVYP
jgi:Amt family ammonium transporter